jgi:hypothetical protein
LRNCSRLQGQKSRNDQKQAAHNHRSIRGRRPGTISRHLGFTGKLDLAPDAVRGMRRTGMTLPVVPRFC